MNENDNIQYLYDNLKKNNYLTEGSIDDFRAYLEDEGNRQSLYDNLKKKNFLTEGSVDDFNAWLGIGQQPAPRVDVSDVEAAQKPSFEEWYKTVPSDRNDTTSYNLRRAYDLAPMEELEAWRTSSAEDLQAGKNYLNSAYENPETGEYEFVKRKDHPTIQMELDWYNSNDPEAVEFRKKYALDKSGDYYKYVPRGEGDSASPYGDLTAENFVAAQQKGRELAEQRKRIQAALESDTEMNPLTTKQRKEYESQLRGLDEEMRGVSSWIDEWNKTEGARVYYDNQKRAVDDVSARIDQMQSDRNRERLNKKREEEEKKSWWLRMAEGLAATENPITPEVVDAITDPTNNDLRTARNEVRNAKNQLQLEEMRMNGKQKGLGFVRGLETANYYELMPAIGMADAMSILQLSQDIKDGKELTDSQKLLKEAMEARAGVDFAYQDNNTLWERIGQSTPEQLMFTLQFVVGAGVTGATKAGEKVAAKSAEKAAKRLAKKEATSAARNFVSTRVVPELEGMAVSSAIQTFANPLSVAGMVEDFEKRYAGDIYYDKDGNLHVFDNDRSAGQAAYQAIASAWIENFTEYAGGNITKSAKLLDSKMFDLAGKFDNVMKTVGAGKIQDVFKIPQQLGRLTQIGSAPEEFLEEELGSVMNALMATDAQRGESYGDAFKNTISSSFAGEQQLETFLSCAITSMLLGGGGNAVNGVRNAGLRKSVNQDVEQSKALLGKVRGIDIEGLDNMIENGRVSDISAYLKEQSDANNWNKDEQGAAVSYVLNRSRQIGVKHNDDTAIEAEQAEYRRQAEDMVNRWDGQNIYNVTYTDRNGETQEGTIVNGRVHYNTNEDGSYTFDPYMSSGMLAIRRADGSVEQVAGRNVTALNNVATIEEQLESQNQTIDQLMRAEFEQDGMLPTVESVWGGNLVPNVTQFQNGRYTYLGQDDNGLYAFANNDKKTSKDNPIVYLTERQLVEYGLSLNLENAQANGDTEAAQKAQDDIDFLKRLDEITADAGAKGQWDVVKAYAQKNVQLDANGDIIPDGSNEQATAAYLLAISEGSFENAIASVDQTIAALGTPQQTEVTDNAADNAAMNNAAATVDADKARQIDFYTNVRNRLTEMQQGKEEADQEEAEQVVANTPVSQMEVGQQFPVEWRGQQAMATVMGKDADGRSVVTVRDMNGEDIEAGIDDMSDAQWEAVRVQPQEATAPEQVPPQVPEQAPEQVEPQQEVPQAAPQQEETPQPQQQEAQQAHPLDDFIAKHGENAENKLGVTIDAINKEIASLAKDLEKAEKDLANMPEPYDEKTQKAQDKQEAKIAKLRTELDEKRNILAPYTAMQEELDRRKEVRQGRENGVTDALTKFTERLNIMLHPKRESNQDMEPQTIEEFIASRLRRKGLARTAVKTINKKTKKMVNGWKYTNPVESLDYDSFKQETGLSDSEMKNFNDPIQPFFTKEGGITFGEFVHSIWEDRGEPGVREDISDSEVRDAVIEFFRSGVSSLKDINDYIENNRRDVQAEQDAMANDMIAQQNGYESGEAMENDLIAQASARADELLGSDTLSDEDVAAFDAELSQRLDNLVPSIEETAEETEPATQETTVEGTEDEDFIQPTDEEAPFSVTGKSNEQIASEYQKQLDEAETESDRAAVIQEYLDTIGTEPAVVMTDATYEAILIENEIPIADILEIRKALADCKANNLKFNAFKYNGKVYMFSEYQDTIEDARTNYVHERQHIFTGGTKKGLSLRDKIKGLASEKELERYVELLSGSDFYTRLYGGTPQAHKVYADEFISMAMERAYNGMDLDAELGKLGIKQELINEIKQLDNEQRTDESLAKARRTSPVNESRQGDNGQNGGNQKRESRKVGGQRSVTVQRGEQAAERRESVKGEVSGILPIDKQTPKNTTIDEVLYSIKVNHDSPYLIKKADGNFIDPITGETLGFDHRFMGKGEGNQAHGWGSYFSVNDLRTYGGQLGGNNVKYKGKDYYDSGLQPIALVELQLNDGNVEAARKELESRIEEAENLGDPYVGTWMLDNVPIRNAKIALEQLSNPKDFEFDRHHYEVEIPDNDGTNYIEEGEQLSQEELNRIGDSFVKYTKGELERKGKLDDRREKIIERGRKMITDSQSTGRDIYGYLEKTEGFGAETTSKILNNAGFVGIHYDGYVDGECYVIFDENDAKIVDHVRFSVTSPEETEDDLRFSTNGTHVISNGKSLVGIHNIGAEKLRKAMKNGGFANPSAAVIDIDKQEHKGYGEVSLIMPSSLVDSRTGRNAGTYAGDAYTPEYPSVSYREGKNTDKLVKDLVKDFPKELGWAIRQGIGEYMDGNRSRSGLEYLFLKEKGQEMPIVKNERRYPDISTEQIDKRLGVEDSANRGHSGELYAAYEKLEGDDLVDFNMWFEAYGDEEKIQQRKDLMEKNAKVKEMLEEQFGEHMGYGKFDTTWYNVLRDERDAGNENIGRTLEDAAIEIDNQGLRSEFEQWKQNVIDGLGYEEVIFDGFTPSGYRRYVPNTVENASRIMNKKNKTNWLSDAGTHATKAMLLDKFNTLNDIRKNRGLLESDQEVINQAYEEASDAWSELGGELADMQQVDDNRFINHDIALNRLQEAMMQRNPAAYLNKEYKYNLDEEFNDRIKEVKQQIKSLPSKYFETKFRRPVYLNEFAAAVVPNDLPQDLKDRLQQSGLPLFEYDPNKEGDRRAVTLEATSGDGIRFSVANRNQAVFVSNAAKAVEGIKQEKATPEQWLKMIEKNGGLKAGEDKWLGLSQWLKDQANTDAPRSDESLTEWAERNRKKTLTKQEVLDFINENAIKIEETHYAETADELPEAAKERLAKLNEEFSELIFEGDVETESIYTSDWVDYALVAMEEKYGDDFRFAFDVEGRGTESRLVPSTDFDGEITDVAKQYLGYEESEEKPIDSVRMQYTTEGLDNKREIALTVPTIEPWNENDEIHFGDAGEGRAVAWIRFGETYSEDNDAAERLKRADEALSDFYDRQDKKYGPGGRIVTQEEQAEYDKISNELKEAKKGYEEGNSRVLVIDEIQSKRHQEGREKGYNDPNAKVLLDKFGEAFDKWKDYRDSLAAKYNIDTYELFYTDRQDVLSEDEKERDKELADAMETARAKHDNYLKEHNLPINEQGIPAAPFEKNWMELAMKRMLRLAAEEGYDKVAWTTGEQQAERYNLGKFYDTIGREDKDDNYRRYVLSGNNVDEIVIDEQNRVVESSVSEAEGKPLSEVVGMDMAVKMENMNDGDELSGNELRIGGEGMKGFYDKMIPSFMNKYGKQWGVKVGEVTMPNLEEGYQTMHSIDVNEQMKADVMEGQVMFSVKNSQKDADDNQLSLFLQNNTGEYETQDGQTIGFTSLLGAATEADAVRGRDNVQRGDDILSYHLRRLEPGETCHVERRYQKSKMFDFTGSEKIESADDVAYIFNKLEDAAVENSFIVLVKDGKPTIIHTGVGSYGSTYVSVANALVAYKNINPDEVWFVHNHPSGSITSSHPDRDSSKRFEKVFGKKYKGGIIIDTTSGKYGVFDSKSDTGSGSTRNTPSNETDIDVYEFSKQVFDKDWNPETSFMARTHQDIATFVSSHRLGEHDKMSLLVLNNNLNVVGNVFLPYESIGEADIKKLTDDVLYYTNQMAGTQAVIYGSFTADDVRDIKKLANNIANAEGRLVDVISTNSDYTGLRSVRMMGAIKEEAQEIKEDEARFSVTAQQDKDYMDAVNRGDMETAQRMVDEAAKAAMPNTKVVDENGNPKVMYHGSVEDFNTFDKNKIREVDYDVDVNGFWFTDEEYMAGPAMQTPNFVRGFFINAENPAHYKEVRRVYKDTREKLRNDGNLVDGARSAHDEVRMRLEDEGFDGVYVDSKPVVNEDELNKKGSTVVQRERSKVVLAKNEEGTLDMFTYSSDGEDHIGNFITGFDDVQDFVDFASTTVVVFEPNQIKSADPVTYDDQGNVIPLSERFNPNNNDIRFSVNGQQRIAVADEYNRETGANVSGVNGVKRGWEKFARDQFDGLRPLEQMQKLIEKALGRKLRDSEKAYELATQLTSKTGQQIDREQLGYMVPVLQQVTDVIKALKDADGYSRDEAYEKVTNYMLAKHGLERNEWFEKQGKDEGDYAGLRGLAKRLGYNTDDYKTAAEVTVKDMEDTMKSAGIDVNEFWKTVNALTNRMLEISYESGMIDKDTFEDLKKRHKYYVPLRGFAEGTAADLFDYVTQSPHFQNIFQKAKGRQSMADDPLANLMSMLHSAIVIGNQNQVMQKIYNLAVNFNSDLLRVTKPWYVYNDALKTWEEKYPDIPEDATADEIDAIVKQFDADMAQLKANGKAKRKYNRIDVGKKLLRYQAKEHEMVAYIDGQRVLMHVAGNPLVAQAMNRANTQRLNKVMQGIQTITRWYSAINTSWSPAFGPKNAERDIRMMLFGAYTTGGIKKMWQSARDMVKAGWALPRLLITGKMDGGLVKALGKQKAAQLEQWWNEFLDNGGETGFTRTLNAEKAKGEVKDMIRHMLNGSKDGENRVRKYTIGLIEWIGRYSEDISRFAAYCQQRAQGESVLSSIQEAKNVTVNFNVKGGGDLAANMRALYSFFNASMQGINRMRRLATEHPGRFSAGIAAMMLGGAVLPWLNMAMFAMLGGDDDDWRKYEELTEYTANHNMILYVGNHKFISIPWSQELAPFNALGNIWFRQQMGWNKGRSVAEQWGDMFVDLSPISVASGNKPGVGLVKTIMPSFTTPIWESLFNEDFTGSPLYKDNQWNKYDASWEKAYTGKTSQSVIDASRWLNEKTDIDINPAIAEHLFSGVLGGMGRSGDKLLRYFTNGFQLQDAPFIRTMMFDSKKQGYIGAVQREYGRNAYDVLPKVKHDMDDMDAMEFAKFSQTEEFEIANLVSVYKTGKDLAGNKKGIVGIDAMEKEYKKIAGASDGSEEYREQLEEIRSAITERKMELLDEIQQIKYEHSNDLRKRIIDRVNEVEQKSKTKME